MSEQEADTALSGEEAIEKARKTSYRIIFLDIGMPEMDGFETALICAPFLPVGRRSWWH